MKEREINKVSEKDLEVVRKYLQEYPVKIGQMAKDLGISIKVSKMDTGVSGQIKREGNKYVIRVNRYEARERQRFTIAHELAHYLLHRDIIDASPDGIRDNVLYRSGKPENVEFEANRLAADIVMPDALIDKKIDEFGGYVTDGVIEKLAADFQVSKAAMEIRMSNLETI